MLTPLHEYTKISNQLKNLILSVDEKLGASEYAMVQHRTIFHLDYQNVVSIEETNQGCTFYFHYLKNIDTQDLKLRIENPHTQSLSFSNPEEIDTHLLRDILRQVVRQIQLPISKR